MGRHVAMDDNKLQSKVDTLLDSIESNRTLDSAVSSVYVEQLDAFDDRQSNEFTLFLDGYTSGHGKATIITEMMENVDMSVSCVSIATDHNHLTFKFIEG